MSILKGVKFSVDYLTITAQGTEESEKLVTAMYDFELSATGHYPMSEPWFFKGFRGYRWEGVAIGKRKANEALVQLSGSKADEYYQRLHPLCSNCTRIDLAATCSIKEQDRSVGLRAYNETSGSAKIKTTLIVNNRGGSTYYTGSRTSRYYGRIYDKSAESNGEPGLIWRYEVEVKKPASKLVYDQLLDSQAPKDLIREHVFQFFAKRGIAPLFDATDTERAIQIPRNLTSDDKVLQWMNRQVSPAVRRLIESGREDDVYKALGLSKSTIDDYFRQFQEDI